MPKRSKGPTRLAHKATIHIEIEETASGNVTLSLKSSTTDLEHAHAMTNDLVIRIAKNQGAFATPCMQHLGAFIQFVKLWHDAYGSK